MVNVVNFYVWNFCENIFVNGFGNYKVYFIFIKD